MENCASKLNWGVNRKQDITAQAYTTGDLRRQQTPFSYPLQDVHLSKLI